MTPFERFRSALEHASCRQQTPGNWTCPAHDDQHASLSIKEGKDSRVLITCHAGCDRDQIVAALGLTMADLFPPREEHKERSHIVATYDYTDEHGTLLYQVVRFQPKDFRQRRRPRDGDPPDKIRDGWVWSLGDIRRVLYHLPRVLAAIKAGNEVWVVEGEKDVHALDNAGVTATTNAMGAGKWRDDYTTTLASASNIVVVADADPTGRTHARTVARKLEQAGCKCRIVQAANGKDAADHLAAGLGPDDFTDLDDDPTQGGPTVADLITILASYQHLDDHGHVWFALAVAISGHAFDGEPLWGMLVGPASSGKTETARALGLVAGHIDDLTASSLISWTKGKNPKPTGVLYRIGQRGVVTIGDFSTVLAMSNKGQKDQLFALLRRTYDGHVTRDLGRAEEQLRWHGRLTILACCTPIIDEYASHADSLGPRWLYYRLPSRRVPGMRTMTAAARLPADEGRTKAAELAEQLVWQAVDNAKRVTLSEQVYDALSELAIVCCFGRAAVPRSTFGRREILSESNREEPARLFKQLCQLALALLALGATIPQAMRIARQAALDSIPQTRRKALELLSSGLDMTVSEIAKEIGCDRKVARHALEDLAAAGVLPWPESYLRDDEDDEQDRWTPRTWFLRDTEVAPLVKRALVEFDQFESQESESGKPAGHPWDTKVHIHREGEIQEGENTHTHVPFCPRDDQQEWSDSDTAAADPLFDPPTNPNDYRRR